ncbi:MAG: HAD family hydrolase [Oscillospiraceae bacterium]
MNKTIFWDFDGTLVYSEHLWSGSLYRSLQRYTSHKDITLDEIRPPMSHGFSWDFYYEDMHELVGEKWWDYTFEHIFRVYKAVGITDSEAKTLLPLFRKTLLETENYHIYPDAVQTLETLQSRGYKHFLLSNNYPELDITMGKIGLAKYFDGMIISAQVGYDKPRHEIFEIALEKAGTPERCFMVGDNPQSDIKGAANIGIPAILVHNDNVQGFECTVCTELSDILDIV